MANKSFNSRIINKHDTAENWANVPSFIPKQGELIVYDVDADYAYERYKIGDGTTTISALPFADDHKLNVADITDFTEEEIAAICTFDGDPEGEIIPIATQASIGCVIAGDGLDIDDTGLLSVTSMTDEEIESICEFDEGITEDNVIPRASTSLLGCVIVGDGLKVDENGVLSSPAISMELLWQNANPTSSFAAQTISLELSDYDGVIVKESLCPAEISYCENILCSKGEITVPSQVYYASIHRRMITVSDTAVVFTDGVRQNTYMSASDATTYNDRLVPVEIYGIKGVQ